VGNGEWRVASGEWRMANGEWRMANGEWRKFVMNFSILDFHLVSNENASVHN
jgi:hypothetical protein